MAILMDFPVILLTFGELMPFSDPVKYCLLGFSVLLLLVAVGILLWQVSMCCAQTQAKQDTASKLPYPDDMSSTPGSWPGIPNTKPCVRDDLPQVEDVCVESHRLSRYLSLGSSESILSDGDGSLDEQANQETQEIHGTLRFSIYYDQLQSRLVVTVLQAEGLHRRNQTRSLHPFVKLRLMQAGSEEVEHLVDDEGEGINRDALWTVVQEWQTRIVKNSSNPLFGEQFICSLQQLQELHHVTLRMEVRDFDKFSRHVILGEVRVPLGEFKRSSYPLELQEDLQTPQKDPVGDVLLSLKFLPTSQRLEVGFLKIRTPPIDTHTDTALNARISLQCNKCKRRHQKTSAVPRRQVTVFNQVLMFSLPELPLQECHILVSVYQSQAASRKSPKHLIGQMNIRKGRSSEDQHWSLMMQSVRQPIAKWHQLLI